MMNVPVRPAPAPPVQDKSKFSASFFDDWGDGNNSFFSGRDSPAGTKQPRSTKKKPPPRPPPPKFEHKKQQKQLLGGLFSKHQCASPRGRTNLSNQKNHVLPLATGGNYRNYSPSPTSRSSSDGLSVNSFGSDGSFTNNAASGGNASIFESGFEDDTDFWLSSSVKVQGTEQNDPWSIVLQDPFSPPPSSQPLQYIPHSNSFPVEKVNRKNSWFEELSKPVESVPSVGKSSSLPGNVPTIIRAKPNKVIQPIKELETTACEKVRNGDLVRHSFTPLTLSTPSTKLNNDENEATSDFDDVDDWEPPMPSVPPPPPPPEVVEELAKSAPPIPPKPQSVEGSERSKPHGIALYDYTSSHPDDLSFKANDVILLKRKVNDEWLFGQLGDKEGMFPCNFIKVVVPLDGDGNCENNTNVFAMYPFTRETATDLEFPEGACIKVLSRISSEWLYGEYNGRKGQFPAIFVDHIPSGLPEYPG